MKHKLGIDIVEQRKLHRLSQQSVSERTGVSRTALSQYESGIRFPQQKQFWKVINAIVPEHDFFIKNRFAKKSGYIREVLLNNLEQCTLDEFIQYVNSERNNLDEIWWCNILFSRKELEDYNKAEHKYREVFFYYRKNQGIAKSVNNCISDTLRYIPELVILNPLTSSLGFYIQESKNELFATQVNHRYLLHIIPELYDIQRE